MFDTCDIKPEDKITPEQLTTLPHITLWQKARKILTGLKMVSFVEEEQAESGKPEYSEECNYQNSILAISEDVLKQVGDEELCLFISYNNEGYDPFGVSSYFIYLPLVWYSTPLKRHGKAYYYPTVKVKPITEYSLITKWPTLDSTVGKPTELTEALSTADVEAVIKQTQFVKDAFTSDVLEAFIDQCQAYPMFNFDMMVPNTQYMTFIHGTLSDSTIRRTGLVEVEDNPDAKPAYVFKYDYNSDNRLCLHLVRLNRATLTGDEDNPEYKRHDFGIIDNSY